MTNRYCVGPLVVMQSAQGALAFGGFGLRLPNVGCRFLSYATFSHMNFLKLPSESNTWMRPFPRSATYTFPCLSICMLCGFRNWLGPVPYEPHDLIQSPFLFILPMRELTYPSLI